MSKENVDLVLRVNEAFNRADWDGMLHHFARDFEYVTSGLIPGAGGAYGGIDDYAGREAVRRRAGASFRSGQ